MWEVIREKRGGAMIALVVVMMVASGCRSLLPESENVAQSKWSSYEGVQEAFDHIVPKETRVADLEKIGFGINSNANVKLLTYLELIQQVMPVASVTKADLDPEIRQCIKSHESAKAYLIELDGTSGKRYGNVCLDTTGFQRKAQNTGWRFKGLIVIRDDVVVYKLSSGEPHLANTRVHTKPLGPLQELDTLVFGTEQK
jgi:hypothetical protein